MKWHQIAKALMANAVGAVIGNGKIELRIEKMDILGRQ